MRLLILIISFFNVCMCIEAQQTINLSQLTGTTWRQVSPNCELTPTTIIFSRTTITRIKEYSTLNKKNTRTFPYYLYTSEPTSFISGNVGNKTKGSYIVKYLSNDKRFYSYKVIGLKNDTLTVYYEPDENAIGGNSKRGFNIVYKRVK